MTTVRPSPILGVYEKPFWDKVQERELHLQRCSNGHFRYPPGPSCPRCLATNFDWELISGRGELISWTVFHRQYFPDLPVPYTVVCGATEEGPLLIANLANPGGQPLQLGMPLRIVFEDTRTKDGDWILYQWSTIDSP